MGNNTKLSLMKVLSKSRFKLGLECPNKIYFSNNTKVFNNIKKEDPFLEALASGGFQVEEYARLHFSDGELIDDPYDGDNYQWFHDKTKELLQKEKTTIYESGFLYESLFVRSDILVKSSNQIKLIEVKAKSFDPNDKYTFVGKQGKIVSSWKPYLFDLAFQTYVVQKCYPEYKVTPYLFLVDKSKKTSIDGLNQLFRIKKDSNKRTGVEVLESNLDKLGSSVMGLVDQSEVVTKILSNEILYHDNLNFQESVDLLRNIRLENKYPNWPTSFGSCKKCEFKNDDNDKGLQSGFKYCFQRQHQWTESDFKKPNTFNIWNFRKSKLFEEGKIFKDDLNETDIKLKPKSEGLSNSERQWIQIQKERDGDTTEYFDKEGFLKESQNWKYPLHFIDFETSTVPLPFHKFSNPYQQIAFQFSHHTLSDDGEITHKSEYINTTPGEFPNFKFIENLYESLSSDQGTIFRYSDHENTILNHIRNQLIQSNYPNKDVYVKFIETISKPTDNCIRPWVVEKRNMVDLCEVIKDFYYHPLTYGSNSIKKVLPAILETSDYINSKYTQEIQSIGVSSKNFPKDHKWLKRDPLNKVLSPYDLLPPVFKDFTEEELEGMVSEIETLSNGGTALTAYGKIQYTDMKKNERDALKTSLLKYCELDTLAMVMIYEHLKFISK